ncbi:MAG: hypothetical protein ACR2KK_13235 [Acidimicrobiales bacterium]
MATGARVVEATQQPRLADVFSGCEILDIDTRLRLAALLSVPGLPMSFRPPELEALRLPLDPGARAAVGTAVAEGLTPDVLMRLAPRSFDAAFPAVAGRPGGLAAHRVPVRLLAVLERQGADAWTGLGPRTVGEVCGWTGIGPTAAAALVGAVVEAGIGFLTEDALRRDGDPAGEGAVADPAGDLAVLLAYERGRGPEAGRLHSAIRHLSEPPVPAPVRAAARRLLVSPAAADPPATALGAADRILSLLGDVRDRVVFEQVVLRIDDPPTPAELRAELGVGRERVRQLRQRALDRATAALRDGSAALRATAEALAAELGSAVPRHALDALLGANGLPPLPDPRSLLVLWLAGPYRSVDRHPGWLATDPVGLVAATRHLLDEDGGVRPVDHVLKDIERLGLVTDLVPAWLDEQPVRLHEGLSVLTTGGPAVAAERALSATGRAMTSEELCTWVTGSGDEGDLFGAAAAAGLRDVLRRDRRFVEVGLGCYELVEWGALPYHDDVPELVEPGRPGEWGRAHDGWWWLRVPVEDHLLSGAGAPVPAGLVECLGVPRRARRAFTTRYGPVVLTNDAAGPARGSLRPVALATGAAAGDALVLRFGPGDSTAAVELVRATVAAG